ncbi:MAG: ribbon-helix-helix protein, CopG family [Halobacteriales archaeon]|nr:ribbon-helix-helix protein, CopG family [Halobacteriales archaeon]
MERVTIMFEEETKESLERLANRDHNGDRDAAVRELMDEWLEQR